MQRQIINPQQSELVPYLKDFKRTFYLAGGTAVALHIGHRRSIDFDLFSPLDLNKSRIKAKLRSLPFDLKPIFEDYDQLHLLINNVKVSFINYPYLNRAC